MLGSTDHCPRMAPTPGCSFVARVAFTYGDRAFSAGDPFPYWELNMTEDGAWNFWRSAMIEVAPESAMPTLVPGPEAEALPPAPAPVPRVTSTPAPSQRSSRR